MFSGAWGPEQDNQTDWWRQAKASTVNTLLLFSPLLDTSIQAIITPIIKRHEHLGFFQSCVDEAVGVWCFCMYASVNAFLYLLMCVCVFLCVCRRLSGSEWMKISCVSLFTLFNCLHFLIVNIHFSVLFFSPPLCLCSFMRVNEHLSSVGSLFNEAAVAAIDWLYWN